MTAQDDASREQQVLRHSIYMVVLYIFVSIAFAILTRSDAILFDGLYSAISLCMALLTLWVARLTTRPDDERFHFGYGALEPFLNLCKSLVIIAICVFAATGSIYRLMLGGTEADYGIGIYYGVLATTVCFGVEIYMRRANGAINSGLIKVEAQSWFMDGLLSVAVLIGFIVASLLAKSSWQEYAPLADPVIVIMLVVVALPVPGRILVESVQEVLTMAPSADFISDIEARLQESLKDLDTQHIEFRVSKRGRQTHILIHLVVSGQSSALSIAEMDELRRKTISQLQVWNVNMRPHLIFTLDRALSD